MGALFRNVNEEILREIIDRELSEIVLRENRERRERRGQYKDPPSRQDDPKLLQIDRTQIESAISAPLPGRDEELRGLVLALLDTSYLHVWRNVSEHLLWYQGDASSHWKPQWQIAKQRAYDILQLRAEILEKFEDVREELVAQGFDLLSTGIAKKLTALERFAQVYNRQPSPATMDNKPEPEPTYFVQPVPRKGSRFGPFPAYPVGQQRSYSALTPIVLVTTVASACLLIPAWERSPNRAGSTTDADFWLLVQGSVMQLLGLVTAIYPLYTSRRSGSTHWLWIQAFTVLGAACAIAAVPLYLTVPTMSSALVSSLGSAAQAWLALQLALVVGSTVEGAAIA